jgi:hypothetical protein
MRAFEIDVEEDLTPNSSHNGRGEQWYHKYQDFAHEQNILPIHAYTLDTYASRAEAVNIISRLQKYSQEEVLSYDSL